MISIAIPTRHLLVSLDARAFGGPCTAANGDSNPVSSIQHPAGEHYQGVTSVAYQGPHEDADVAAATQSGQGGGETEEEGGSGR